MSFFQDITLAPALQKALTDLKFIEPTPIQRAVMPLALEGHDIIACAETGSGKTAAYALPLLSRLLEDRSKNALILAPTRELAFQIADFLRQLVAHCSDMGIATIVGGVDMRRQIQALRKNPRILVATPGRLNDHLNRRTMNLETAAFLVLDEGDRMLDMGFAPQLDDILEYLPEQRQALLFTATLPEKVRRLAQRYLSQPKNVEVGRTSLPVAAIQQSVVEVVFDEKKNRIVEELQKRQGSIIIFTRTQRRADHLASKLEKQGFTVELIHGGCSQGQRTRALKNFKSGRSRILCATDIAARGLDIPQVEHVINFDLPAMDEDYVHRIGRTARNGAKGEAVSFVTPEERHIWRQLARKYQIKDVELKGTGPESATREPGRRRFPKNRTRKFSRDFKKSGSASGAGSQSSSGKPFRGRPSRNKSSGSGPSRFSGKGKHT